MRHSILLALVLAAVGASPQNYESPTFREAARDAGSIVRVRVIGGEESAATFKVVEILRGRDVPDTIIVPSSLWGVHRPKPIPTGDVTYLVLLRTGEELLCGHMNGMVVISHTCIGIVPVVGERIPAAYASRYEREATEDIELSRVRKDLRTPK